MYFVYQEVVANVTLCRPMRGFPMLCVMRHREQQIDSVAIKKFLQPLLQLHLRLHRTTVRESLDPHQPRG